MRCGSCIQYRTVLEPHALDLQLSKTDHLLCWHLPQTIPWACIDAISAAILRSAICSTWHYCHQLDDRPILGNDLLAMLDTIPSNWFGCSL